MGKPLGSRSRASVKLEQRCVALARRGLTAPAIAIRVGIGRRSVYRILKRAGVRAPSSRDASPLANRRRVLTLVARLGAEGAAAELGVSRQAVYDRVQRWSAEAGGEG